MVFLLFCVTLIGAQGQVGHEKLLPSETILMFTTPDIDKTIQLSKQSPQGKFWSDPSIQAAKEKFISKWKAEVVEPLEKELGLKFSDYSGIASGQVTIAIPFSKFDNKQHPIDGGFVFLMESGVNKEKLAKSLTDTIQKYSQGHNVITNKIRDIDFYELEINSQDVSKIIEKIIPDPSDGWESLDGPKQKPKNVQYKISIGKVDSLFIASSSTNWVDKVVANKLGKSVGCLSDNENFKKFSESLQKDTTLCGWVNIEPLIKLITPVPEEKQNKDGFNVNPAKILNALGLNGIKGIEMTAYILPEGGMFDLFLRVPSNERSGLIKALIPEQKDTSVPPYVPSNVVNFIRYRLDLQKTWATVESELEKIDPKIPNLINLMLQTAGKAKDPNFDWKKNIIGTMGDDLIIYSKNPPKATIENINNSANLFLLSSTNPEQLANSIKFLTLLSPKPPEVKEREIAGKKVYYWENPKIVQNPDKKTEARFTFVSPVANYIAIANDLQILQEFLNYSEGKYVPLKNFQGLADAIKKIGSDNSGMLIFQNTKEQTRFQYTLLKNETDTIASILAMTPIGIRLGLAEDSKLLRQWIDPTLLPEFDKIAKYFGITVSELNIEDAGIRIKSFNPNPPGLN